MNALVAEPSLAPPTRELDRLAGVAEETIRQCRTRGADAVEVHLSVEQGLAVNVRLGDVETLEHTKDRGLSLTVYVGGRKGSASTADLKPESLKITIEQAIAIARHTEVDSAAGLAAAEDMAKTFPDLDLWHPSAVSADDAIELALRCEAAALDDKRIRNSEGAGVSISRGFGIYANSHGFIGREMGTRHSLQCSVLAGPDEAMQRDYHYSLGRGFDELMDAAELGRETARRTIARIGARTLASQKTPAILSAEVARSFFGHLVSAVSGGALYRKASFLLDAVGQQVFPSWMQIAEAPHLLRGLGSAAFDDDGLATRAQDLIRDGMLTRYVLSTYSARKLGLASTANAGGVHNLIVTPNAGALDELFRAMGRGLYVTELLGQGVSLITGDYSRGAAGYWIENGEIAYPVHEITIAGNLRSMFADLIAVGSDIDLRGNVRTGPVWLAEMSIAGEGAAEQDDE